MPIDDELLTAIYRGDTPRVDQLLSRGVSVGDVDSDGFTPLFYAVLTHHPEPVRSALVKRLMEAGADVNHRDSDQEWTALALAAREGLTDVCGLLLDAGAKVDSQDRFGNTPLWRALFCNQAPVVSLLLSRGANPDLANRHGTSPRRLAKDVGRPL